MRALQTFLYQKLPKSNPIVEKPKNKPTTLKLTLKNKNQIDETNHAFKCFFFEQSKKFQNILSNLFSIFSSFFKFCIIYLSDILEILFLSLIVFCNFFIIFYSLAQTYVNFSKITDHLLRYETSNNYINVPTTFQ